MKVSLNWITPEPDSVVGYIARVSNSNAQPEDSTTGLIRYLLKHSHWSPFEMACMCVEINTTRDIGRQILRHRAFHFQEFSQRYSIVAEKPEFSPFARLQDPKNRQNSLTCHDKDIEEAWQALQQASWECDYDRYKEALKLGIAKELARKLLPEGLVQTKMYMQGTLRDWLHYIGIRQGPETQLEHRQIAYRCGLLLEEQCPDIARAAIDMNILRPFAFDD